MTGCSPNHDDDVMTAGHIRTRVDQRMREVRAVDPESMPNDYDFSTPEAEEAIRAMAGVLLEIRHDVDTRLVRRVRLYERTLGLAVIPVLIRRAIGKAMSRSPLRRGKFT